VDEYGACEDIELAGSVSLGETKVRFTCPLAPILMQLGGEQGKRLQLYPEPMLTAEGGTIPSGAYLIDDPEHPTDTLHGFLRLVPGDSLILGRDEPEQQDLMAYPETVAKQHLRLKLTPEGLTFKNLAPSQGSCLSPLAPKAGWKPVADLRLAKIERLAKRLGAPIAEPAPGGGPGPHRGRHRRDRGGPQPAPGRQGPPRRPGGAAARVGPGFRWRSPRPH
jgi:hypothetical protein